MGGAIQLLLKLRDRGIRLEKGADAKIYSDAIYECLSDKRNMDMFLNGGHIEYHAHETNPKGKLIKCKTQIIF